MPLSSNRLLAGLPAGVRSCVGARLDPVKLSKGSLIYAPGQSIDDVYFVAKGIAALAWPSSDAAVDVAMIGPDGMLGCAVSFGAPKAVFKTLARSDLIAARMRGADFEELLDRTPDFRLAIVQFAAGLTAQIAETAYVNARLTVEQRVARWILLASTGLKATTIRFTHDELASAVGCRRAGVTVALHMLEGERIIRARRSQISILDQERLRNAAQAAGEPPPRMPAATC